MRVASLVLVVVASAGAFAPPTPTFQAKPTVGVSSSTVRFLLDGTQDDQQVRRYEFPSDNGNISNQKRSSKLVPAAGSVMMAWLTTTGVANADSPDWGIFEGRTGSLLHPLTMGSLFVFSLYTAFLGFQWRRQRTIGDEIAELKKSMPSLGSYKTINEALASGEIDNAAALQAAIPIEQQIQALTAERKELSSQNNRDRHYGQGSWIALIGTLFAIEVNPIQSWLYCVVIMFSRVSHCYRCHGYYYYCFARVH